MLINSSVLLTRGAVEIFNKWNENKGDPLEQKINYLLTCDEEIRKNDMNQNEIFIDTVKKCYENNNKVVPIKIPLKKEQNKKVCELLSKFKQEIILKRKIFKYQIIPYLINCENALRDKVINKPIKKRKLDEEINKIPEQNKRIKLNNGKKKEITPKVYEDIFTL